MTEQKARKVATSKVARAVTSKTKNTRNTDTGKPGAAKKTSANKSVAKSTRETSEKVPGKVKATKAKVAAKSTAKPASARKKPAKPTPEERYRMVEITAYFIAERNGFQGDSTEHWAAAEREITAKLGQ